MKSLTYTSACGMIVQFSSAPPFLAKTIDLNAAVASFDESKATGTDGTRTLGGNYDKKVVVVEGVISASSHSKLEELRGILAMTMNVHHEGVLLLEQDSGQTKTIKCRPLCNPSFAAPFGLTQGYTAQFQCDAPYWLDSSMTIVPIGQIMPMWQFPFTPPVTFGKAIGTARIMNYTSIEIPLRIEVLTQSTLIELENKNTGQAFRIDAVITQNKKMVIDGDNCDVDIIDLITGEKTNATNKLVAGSKYITLSPGMNEIEIHNGIADATPLSYITYYLPHLAV